jgi:glc operon protein GlcG
MPRVSFGRLAAVMLVAMLIAVSSRATHAQVVQQPVLSLEAAKRVIAAAEAEARKQQWTVAIAVVDPSGGLIAFERLEDTQPASLDISIAKARSAVRFKRPTKALADAVTAGRVALVGVDGVLALEGGLPILVNGKVVGAIGVSGMSSEQDGVVAKAGADAVDAKRD